MFATTVRGFGHRPARSLTCLFALGLALAPAVAQQIDLDRAEGELASMFDRPAGTPIGEPQKQRLTEFLQRYEGQDLGRLGYARALACYFRRDATGGAELLDAFFAQHFRIAHTEHRTMAGRIYLVALREEVRREPADATRLHRWAENAVAQFPDLQVVARQASLLQASVADPVGFRLALVKGLHRSTADAVVKDQFLTLLYGQGASAAGAARSAGGDVVAGSPTPAVPPPPPAAGLAVGADLPDLPIEHVLNQPKGFRWADQQGKVLVIDCFATWCPPCRAGIASLVALQQQHAGAVQVVGMTRCYGRGMDFTAGHELPHGGKVVTGLAREAEIAVNERFVQAFGIQYPVVFTTEAALRDQVGATSIPLLLVVGKDGKLAGRVLGSGEAAEQKLKKLVADALR